MNPAVVSRSLVLSGAGRCAGAQCLRTPLRFTGGAEMTGALKTSNRATLGMVFGAEVSVRAVLNNNNATAAAVAVKMPEAVHQNERPRRGLRHCLWNSRRSADSMEAGGISVYSDRTEASRAVNCRS